MRCINLNHCAAKNPNEIVNLEEIWKSMPENENVIVLDYTSATTEMISTAVKLFILKVPILFLVSSGIKNEQIGADINPYGTFRIIARNLDILDKLCFLLKARLGKIEVLPKESTSYKKSVQNCWSCSNYVVLSTASFLASFLLIYCIRDLGYIYFNLIYIAL